MRRADYQRAGEPQVDGLNMAEIMQRYQSGMVTAFVDGQWKVCTVQGVDVGQNGKLSMDVLPLDDIKQGTGRAPEKVVFDNLPEPVEFAPGAGVEEPDPAAHNAQGPDQHSPLMVADVHIDRTGRVEYTVTDSDGNEYTSVSQELLLAIREAGQLEDQLARLQDRIRREVVTSHQDELLRRTTDIDELVSEAFSHLPRKDQYASQTRAEVEAIRADVGKVHARATRALEELTREVGTLTTTKGTGFEAAYTETRAEQIQRTESAAARHEEEYKFIQEFDRQVEAAAERELGEIAEQRRQRLEEVVGEKRTEHDAAEQAKKDADRNYRKKPFTDEMVAAVSLPAADVERFNKMATEKREEVALRTFNKMVEARGEGRSSPAEQAFVDEIIRKRKEYCEADRATDSTQIFAGRAGRDYQFGTDAYNHYTRLSLHDVINRRTRDYEGGEAPEANAEAFDFDRLINVAERAKIIQAEQVPRATRREGPRNGFEGISQGLLDLAAKAREVHQKWSVSVDKLSDEVEAQVVALSDRDNITPEVALARLREVEYRRYLNQLHELEMRLQQTKARQKADKAPVYERKETVGFIDIPESVLRQEIFGRGNNLEKFKAAMKVLYRDAFKADGGRSLSGEALNAFQRLIPQEANKDMLLALAPYGVKSWDDFKKVWDTRMAPKFGETLRVSAQAKVRTKLAEKISLWDKVKALKGDVATRIATTLTLVGGASFLASAAAGAVGINAILAAIGGGTVGGGLRGLIHSAFLGNEEKRKAKMQKMYAEKIAKESDGIINALLDEQFGGSGTSANLDEASAQIDQLPELTAIMTQTIRDVSAKIDKQGIKEVDALSGEARGRYERALAQLEPRDRTEKNKRDLAIALSKLTDKGEQLEVSALQNLDSRLMAVLGIKLKDLSGHHGMGRGALTGGALAGAFMVSNGWTRGVIGGLGGAKLGYDYGKAKGIEQNREQARSAFLLELHSFRTALDSYRQVLSGPAPITAADTQARQQQAEQFRATVMEFKSMLHGEIAEEYIPAFYVDETAQNSEHAVQERNKLVSSMRELVYEAEGTGILLEQQEGTRKLGSLVEQLQSAHHEAADVDQSVIQVIKDKTEDRRWNKTAAIYTAIGAGVGAATSLLLGAGFTWGREATADWMGTSGSESTPSSGSETATAAAETVEMQSIEQYADAHSEPAKTFTDSAKVEPEPAGVTADEVPDDPGNAAEEKGVTADEVPDDSGEGGTELEVGPPKPEAITTLETSEPNLVKKGGNTITSMNRFKEGSKFLGEVDKSTWTAEQTAAWEKMQGDAKAFRAWKLKQLHDMGYRWRGGKLGSPMSPKVGAEMKLFFDPNGGEPIMEGEEVVGQSGEWRARYSETRVLRDAKGEVILGDHGNPKTGPAVKVYDELRFRGGSAENTAARDIAKNSKDFVREIEKGRSYKPVEVTVSKAEPMKGEFSDKTYDFARTVKRTYADPATADKRPAVILDDTLRKQVPEGSRVLTAEPVDNGMAVKLNLDDGSHVVAQVERGAVTLHEGTKAEKVIKYWKASEYAQHPVEGGAPRVKTPDARLYYEDFVGQDDATLADAEDGDAYEVHDFSEAEAAAALEDKVVGAEPTTAGRVPDADATAGMSVQDIEKAAAELEADVDDVDAAPAEAPEEPAPAEATPKEVAPVKTEAEFKPERLPNNEFSTDKGTAMFRVEDGKIMGLDFAGRLPSGRDLSEMLFVSAEKIDAKMGDNLDVIPKVTELGKFLQVHDAMTVSQVDTVHTIEFGYVKQQMGELMSKIAEDLRIKPEKLFKPELLNAVGIKST